MKDVERATAFYRDVLGLPLLFTVPSMAFFDCGGVRLMLGTASSPEYDHPSSIFYFRVPDIQAGYQRLVRTRRGDCGAAAADRADADARSVDDGFQGQRRKCPPADERSAAHGLIEFIFGARNIPQTFRPGQPKAYIMMMHGPVEHASHSRRKTERLISWGEIRAARGQQHGSTRPVGRSVRQSAR